MRISDWSSDVCSSDLRSGWRSRTTSSRRWAHVASGRSASSAPRRPSPTRPTTPPGCGSVPSRSPRTRSWTSERAGTRRNARKLAARDPPSTDLHRLLVTDRVVMLAQEHLHLVAVGEHDHVVVVDLAGVSAHQDHLATELHHGVVGLAPGPVLGRPDHETPVPPGPEQQ